jgi:uncharacterized protein with PQ loop repeat
MCQIITTKNTKNMYGEIILYGLCFLSIVTYLVYSCCFNNKEKTDETLTEASTIRSASLDRSHKRDNELVKRIKRRLKVTKTIEI